MKPQERRQYSRKTLNPLPYINLPSGNGGIVLDVSEQGLRFRASAPMEQSGPILFWFTARSTLVSGVGELVWIDEARKTGGLRFTQLPYNALEQIRKWPHDANVQMGVGQDLTLHIPSPDESPSTSANDRGPYAALNSVTSSFERLLPESFKAKVKEGWLAVQENDLPTLNALTSQAYLEKYKRLLSRATYALLLGIVISTLVYAGHRQAGELLVSLGTRLSGEVATRPTAPTVVTSQGSGVDDGSPYKSTVDDLPVQAVPQSLNTDAGKISEVISKGAPAPQIQETPSRPQKPVIQSAELVVQVAALAEEGEARKLTDTLRHENFQAFVGTLPADSFYRVMLGPYADEASARVVLGKLKKAGFDSFIRRESFTQLSDLNEQRHPDGTRQSDQQVSSNSLPRVN